MGQLFGDATTAMPTPATLPERESLMGIGSPVPSLDIRRGSPGVFGAGNAIPGLNIEPPTVSVENGKPQVSNGKNENNRSEGFGSWVARTLGRGSAKGNGTDPSYKRLGQDDD